MPISIRSILNQSYSNFEFLIIDDGSTDNTKAVVESFTDYRIRYVRKINSRLADTLNFGLKIAKYDWIARMDADDIAHPRRIESQLSSMSFEENEICVSNSLYFENAKIKYCIDTPVDSDKVKEKLSLHSIICHSSVVYNRNFILAKGGYNKFLKVFEDYELWLRIKDEVKFNIINKYLMYIRINPKSLQRNNSHEKQRLVYMIQEPYYINFQTYFQSVDTQHEMILRGWREYFYGEDYKAIKHWKRLGIRILKYPRVLMAIILIKILPQKDLISFRNSKLKLKLDYQLKKILRNRKILKGLTNYELLLFKM